LQQPDAAEKELQTALRLNSKYLPALLNLANLNEDRGRRATALTLYERILALDPGCSEALARYANLKTISQADDPLLGQLQTALARTAATAADKASLAFALGKTLDGCGAFDKAFDSYVAANRYSRASVVRGGTGYNRRQQEEFVSQLIATFDRVSTGVPEVSSTAYPIFICGMFRSGSTLTEQVLAGHSQVTSGGELDLLPALARSQLTPFPAAMSGISSSRINELTASYLVDLAKLFPGANFVTDKRPDNFLYIGLIKRLFPKAKIIHTTRDPLDNCLSIFFLHLDHSMSYALDLMDTGHYYRQYQRLMAHWKTLYGPDILDFNYDAFVHEPKPAVEQLLAHCGLDWEDNCLNLQRESGVVKTASVWQVREPVYLRSSGRWRNYAKHLAALRSHLDGTDTK
jgi:tetratricopeptide (TPR) repeat protein